MFLIMGQPKDGISTMHVDDAETLEAAMEILRQKETKYSKWRFWIDKLKEFDD